MNKIIAQEDFICTHCETEHLKGEVQYTHWAGDGSLCKNCGESLES